MNLLLQPLYFTFQFLTSNFLAFFLSQHGTCISTFQNVPYGNYMGVFPRHYHDNVQRQITQEQNCSRQRVWMFLRKFMKQAETPTGKKRKILLEMFCSRDFVTSLQRYIRHCDNRGKNDITLIL